MPNRSTSIRQRLACHWADRVRLRSASLAEGDPIQRASPAHARALAAIHAASFATGQVWGADAISLQLQPPGAYGFVHEAGGFVLARVAADEAEILTIAVHPDVRRRGIGRNLLRRALAEAGAREATVMLLEVSSSNVHARSMYVSAGFLMVGQRTRYYADGSDAIILRALVNNPRVG